MLLCRENVPHFLRNLELPVESTKVWRNKLSSKAFKQFPGIFLLVLLISLRKEKHYLL